MLPTAASQALLRFARHFMAFFTGAWVNLTVQPGSVDIGNTNDRLIIACNHRTAYDLLPFFKVCQPSVLLDKGCVRSRFAPRIWLVDDGCYHLTSADFSNPT